MHKERTLLLKQLECAKKKRDEERDGARARELDAQASLQVRPQARQQLVW
jgi:hypothetical protein